MGIYMGPIWATHKGLMKDLQHGSMLDPHGQSNMGTIWELYGSSKGKKSTHIYLPEKKNNNKLLHIFIQMIISPQSQLIFRLVRSQQGEIYVQEALKI